VKSYYRQGQEGTKSSETAAAAAAAAATDQLTHPPPFNIYKAFETVRMFHF